MASTATDTLAVSTVVDLSTDNIQRGERVEGLLVAGTADCAYCGGTEVPMVDTRTGRTVLPHRRDAKSGACVRGTVVAPATVANTTNLL